MKYLGVEQADRNNFTIICRIKNYNSENHNMKKFLLSLRQTIYHSSLTYLNPLFQFMYYRFLSRNILFGNKYFLYRNPLRKFCYWPQFYKFINFEEKKQGKKTTWGRRQDCLDTGELSPLAFHAICTKHLFRGEVAEQAYISQHQKEVRILGTASTFLKNISVFPNHFLGIQPGFLSKWFTR